MATADITELIVLADQEIADRGLSSRGSVKTISMFLTASMIALKQPQTASLGPMSATASASVVDWRGLAESLIQRSGTPPIHVANDPLPNE